MVKTQFQILKSVSKYNLNCLESRFVFDGSISGSQRNRLKQPGNKKDLNSGPFPYSIKDQKIRCSSPPSFFCKMVTIYCSRSLLLLCPGTESFKTTRSRCLSEKPLRSDFSMLRIVSTFSTLWCFFAQFSDFEHRV